MGMGQARVGKPLCLGWGLNTEARPGLVLIPGHRPAQGLAGHGDRPRVLEGELVPSSLVRDKLAAVISLGISQRS